ncbi:hypothetical protein CK203_081048 [Vitis vinifera]|uniref:DUF659 domain-containing protein n=1 Tax=Vitis vinifera TaxID=29760 RepID=A0A438DWP2_VITVI|nr:hypothetical protein CK203_081048 [Vitis vinifera]
MVVVMVVVGGDDDDDGDDDVYMYPADMHPDERHAYREAVRASKAAEWNRQQQEHFIKGKRKTGESSHPTNPTTRQMRKSQSVRYSDASLPDAPIVYKSSAARQKTVKNLFKGGAIKETMGRLISKFFIYESVPPSKADSHHFKNMIVGAQQAGMGIEPPSPYEIKHKYLDMEYKDMEAYVNIQREKWKTYGCTIMSDGWTGPTKLSIINFMVYSKGSTIFLKSVDASNNIKDNKYIYGLLKDVIKEVGKQNVVQIVTDNGSAFVKAGKLLMKKYNLYWTPCAAHCIDLMFEDIGKRTSVADLITKARKITNFIYNHSWLLAQMRKVCGGDIVRPGATRFATNYIALDSLLKKKANLKKVFISDEWAQHNLSRTLIGKEVESLMFDHAYWERVGKLVSIYEALYTVLRIVDSEVVPTMPFVYELIRVMKENLIRLNAKEWVLEIIADRWDRTLKHPLHAAAFFLNPRFQYKRGVGTDPDLLQAVHEVFAKLDPTSEGLSQFGNEIILFRDAKRGFGDRAAIASRSEMVPAEWWFMYGHHAPTLRRLAIKVLSQTASSSACERNWSTFALIHTKQRNRLAYPMLQQLVFCYYNMKLKIRDMEAEQDKVAEKDYLDLLDIATEVGEEEDNQLFQWVRPLHLDDEDGNPDPRIAAHVREAGVDVDRVLSEEVHTDSFSQDTRDSFQQGISQPAVTSRPSFDSTSVEHSSRPSATGTSASGYDGSRGEGTNDGSDPGNDEGDVRQQQQSGQPLAFTCEDDFTHCTQDEDHGSRRAGPGVGAIGKPYRGRQRRMMPYNEDSLSASFESMSVETQFSDSSNEANIYAPYAMSYGQPPQNLSSSTDEEYERYNYPSSTQMPYYLPHQLQQQGFQTSTWENPGFPIHGQVVGRTQEIYAWHVRTYNQYYRNSMSWYEYCLQQDGLPSSNNNNMMEPHRSSFWY